MDFQIPLRKEDLLNPVSDGQFRVEELLTVREIIKKLEECKNDFKQQGPVFILDNFNIFYSCIMHYNSVDSGVHNNVWKLLKSAMSALTSDLTAILGDEEMDNDNRDRNLTVLKMVTYVLCQYIFMFENQVQRSASQTLAPTGKGKKAPTTSEVIGNLNWADQKIEIVNILQLLIELPLQQLWTPPVIEEDFVNMIANCCYKFMENVTIKKTRELKDAVFNLLGNLLKRHNHIVSVAIKIVQMLQLFEHLTTLLGQCVVLLIEKFCIKSILSDIIREIGNNCVKDVTDGATTRCFSLFLAEVGQSLPQAILSNISVLVTHLEGESYSMRNCVLGIMSDILLRTIDTESMDDKSRTLRDQFMDCLEDHLRDTNAFVRSKVLQIWTKLCQDRIIPLARQEQLLRLTTERLQDRSSIVRKNAIQLLTAILQGNPFAAKLTLDKLQHSYDKEKAKLVVLCPDFDRDASSYANTVEVKRQVNWNAMKKDLNSFLRDAYPEDIEDSDLESDNAPLPMLGNRCTAERICQFLNAANFKDALEELEKELLSVGREQVAVIEKHNDLSQESREESSDADEASPNPTPRSLHLKASVVFQAFSDIYFGLNPAPELFPDGCDDGIPDPISVDEASDDIAKQKVLVHYLKDSIRFSELVYKALPFVCQLLGSKTNSDVLEAIEFFVTAFEFGVQSALIGIRKMLSLVWSKEAGIKAAVVLSYKRLYLKPVAQENGQTTDAYHQVASNLSTLTRDATIGQLTSLDELIHNFVTTKVIDGKLYGVLWKRFSNQNNRYTGADSSDAILLLGMIGSADPKVIKENINLLVEIGLGERAETDFQFARDVCEALLKINGNEKPSVESKECPFRISNDHVMFVRLAHIIVNGISKLEDRMFVPFSEKAIGVIYKLADNPDLVCEKFIKQIIASIVQAFPNNADVSGSQPDVAPSNCSSAVLARLLSMCGHVALLQLVHLDINVFCELKRRDFLKEESKKKSNQRKNKRKSFSATSSLNKTGTNETADDDCDIMGATTDDGEAEFIRKILDKELVLGGGLLAKMAHVIVLVAVNQSRFPNSDLQMAASLALGKYMLVSCDFCENNMQLLVTIIDKSPNPIIRGNCVTVMGDLACRYPNTVDPWIQHLYSRLRDESFNVRYNALTILTHLILHDMTRVRGHISHVALCVVDQNERISGLAKLFFQELSGKGNSIFNVLPDIICRLSDQETGTTEEIFKTVMKFLLPLVQKDKLLDSMIEKLCGRFKDTRSPRHWRNLSFCLSIMCTNMDKSIIKLSDLLPLYTEALAEIDVYEYFQGILANARKMATKSVELTTLIDELEEKIDQIHNKGCDENMISQNAATASKRASKMSTNGCKGRQAPRNVLRSVNEVRTTRRKASQQASSPESDGDDDFTEDRRSRNKVLPTADGRVLRKGMKKPIPVAKKRHAIKFSDSDSEN